MGEGARTPAEEPPGTQGGPAPPWGQVGRRGSGFPRRQVVQAVAGPESALLTAWPLAVFSLQSQVL